jgi:hypothetical protein
MQIIAMNLNNGNVIYVNAGINANNTTPCSFV